MKDGEEPTVRQQAYDVAYDVDKLHDKRDNFNF